MCYLCRRAARLRPLLEISWIVMSGMRDFFSMTRRERQGTVALLAVIALLLLGTVAVRSCRPMPPLESSSVEMQRFEDDVDSSSVTVTDKPSKRQARPTRRAPKRSPHPKKSKPHTPPRPVDPVPTF